MKTYSDNIGKLYESAAGFGKIVIGETYVSKKGDRYTVKEIYIAAEAMKPDVNVVYDFETKGGETGSEENGFTIFVDMLRNA